MNDEVASLKKQLAAALMRAEAAEALNEELEDQNERLVAENAYLKDELEQKNAKRSMSKGQFDSLLNEAKMYLPPPPLRINELKDFLYDDRRAAPSRGPDGMSFSYERSEWNMATVFRARQAGQDWNIMVNERELARLRSPADVKAFAGFTAKQIVEHLPSKPSPAWLSERIYEAIMKEGYHNGR